MNEDESLSPSLFTFRSHFAAIRRDYYYVFMTALRAHWRTSQSAVAAYLLLSPDDKEATELKPAAFGVTESTAHPALVIFLPVNLAQFKMVYNLLVSGYIHERHRFVAGNTFLPVNRKAVHAAIGLILILCVVFPLVEPVLGWNNNIFVTGHDTESTLAVVILLLELVLALAGILVFLLAVFQVIDRILEKSSPLNFESGFHVAVPDLSPPVPLRI